MYNITDLLHFNIMRKQKVDKWELGSYSIMIILALGVIIGDIIVENSKPKPPETPAVERQLSI